MRYSYLAFASVVALSLGACASCAAAGPLDAGPPAAPQGPPTMPALTISAVDTTANTLTINAHGLNTGDGPAAVRNIGGALPAATPALGPVLDRFAIRVDANTIKLAASNADAIAGTPIDITSTGSGTNLLEIGVPYRRPRSYGPGVQLKSDDLNANFDSWVALYDLLTGQTQSPAIWNGITLSGDITIGGNATISGSVRRPRTIPIGYISNAPSGVANPGVSSVTIAGSGQALEQQITLEVGNEILAVRANVIDSVTGPTKLKIVFASGILGSPVNVIATSSISAGSGALQTLTLSGLTTTVATGTTYWLWIGFDTGTSSSQIGNVEIDVR